MSYDNQNVVYLSQKQKTTELPAPSVPALCAVAKNLFEDAIVLGTTSDGSLKMITSFEDVNEIIQYLETTKQSLLADDS